MYISYAYGTGYLLEKAFKLQIRQAGFEVYTGAMRNAEILDELELPLCNGILHVQAWKLNELLKHQ